MKKRICANIIATFMIIAMLSRTVVAEPAQISDFGRQAAEDFLSEWTSIFTGVRFAETIWNDDNGSIASTGRFLVGWDSETRQSITTEIVPEIYFAPIESGDRHEWGFFDNRHRRIYDATWLYTQTAYYFADHFKLFDFDNDGIPEIFIHFQRIWPEGGHSGFYRIFKYIDGEYRMLEYKNYDDDWLYSRIGDFHELFFDENGRIIAFANNEYTLEFMYSQLVFTDEHVELHPLVNLHYSENLEAWRAHHWQIWEQKPHGRERVDGWIYDNPTMFGTDIRLIYIQPLIVEQNQITVLINQRRGLTRVAAPMTSDTIHRLAVIFIFIMVILTVLTHFAKRFRKE